MFNRRQLKTAFVLAVFFTIAGLQAGLHTAHATEPETDLVVRVEIPAGADYMVTDVLDGVEARYRTRAYDDTTGVYSCAGYVKAYCEAVYGIEVYNLIDAGPPSPQEMFKQVETPQKGDIIFYASPPNRNNHSAIVKAFDGQRITLIEQNVKWGDGQGNTYTYVNQTIPYPPDENNIYQIWRPVFVEDTPDRLDCVLPPDAPETTPEPETPAEPETPVEPEPTTDWTWTEPETVPETPETWQAVVTIDRMAITVNGKDMPIDAPALIEMDRTIVPVRWAAVALGIDEDNVLWDDETRTVTIKQGPFAIAFVIGENVLTVNGVPMITMDCPAVIRYDRAYLPVKFLADTLGIQYTWDDAARSVTLFW